MTLKILLQPEADGGYSVSVPAFPGCHSQGETREEAIENIKEAAELWLETSLDRVVDRSRGEVQEIVL
ncbi:MAG TPA: type II toxin-antitoxin system HicB family antitoxin [Fimbriiglobus sp.]|jgi:predicted RNase H-like HicB family nuclease